ncbi:MAG: choice-of-anchor D domain-containing protein [Myxococcota bacterium]
MVRRSVLALGLLAACSGQEVQISLPTPTISVLPDAIDFGAVVALDQDGANPVNQRATETVFLENTGRADLDWSLTLDSPGFVGPEVRKGLLEPGDDLEFELAFEPPTLGPFTGTLTVTSNDEARPSIEIPLTGEGRVPFAPDIAINPLIVDFGDVELGNVAQRVVTIANEGDAALTLGTAEQGGAGTFRLASGDPSGTVLLPKASLPVLVEFTAVQLGGDSGTWTVRSDDPDEPALDVVFIANGGGEYAYPEAVITNCPATADVTQPVRYTLSGVNSTDPDGGALTYVWSLVRRPQAGDPSNVPLPDDDVETELTIDAAGIWEVTLVVTNEAGRPSVPAKCVIDATPIDDVYIELSWAGPTSDLDLHLARDAAPFFDVPNDVSYCNPAPDWGTPGDPTDDPRLALDDSDGLGPEIITLPMAPDGTYLVRVHHFDDGDDGAVTATVVVYADGDRITETSAVLGRNEVWEVGQINWPDATFGTSTAPVFDAGGERECDL